MRPHSTTPFTSITMTNTANGDFIEYDNVRYANVVPLPAAAWFGLVLMGGIGAKRVSKRSANTEL